MKPVIIACTGLDKPEGSVAREVAILVAEADEGEIVCPVLLNRAPARYKKELSDRPIVVVDGCSTRCVSKLPALVDAKVVKKVLVSDAVKASGQPLETGLRLGPNGLALARTILQDIVRGLEPTAPTSDSTATFGPPTEYLVVTHDKFEFRVPKEDYLFNENDVWVRHSDGVARVGISDYMQQKLTDISFFEPYSANREIVQFDTLCDLESTKAVFEVISPVSGTVVAVNNAVAENPGLINEDPYGAGWLLEIKLTAWTEDMELLLDSPTYAETLQRKAAEY
jgi:glycine cleavage system H protein